MKNENNEPEVSIGKIDWFLPVYDRKTDTWIRKHQIRLEEAPKCKILKENLLFAKDGHAIVNKKRKEDKPNPKTLDVLRITRKVGKGRKRRLVTQKVVKSDYIQAKERLRATDSAIWHPRLNEEVIGTPKSLKKSISVKSQTKHLNHLPRTRYGNYTKFPSLVIKKNSGKTAVGQEKGQMENSKRWKGIYTIRSRKRTKPTIRGWIDSNPNRNPRAKREIASELKNSHKLAFFRKAELFCFECRKQDMSEEEIAKALHRYTQIIRTKHKRPDLFRKHLKDGQIVICPHANRHSTKPHLTKAENELLVQIRKGFPK